MCYSKCGLCHQNLEAIKSASGLAYIRCLNWKECPSFYPEENIHGYQQCVCVRVIRVIPEYKVYAGGKPLLCKNMDTPTLRVSRSVKNPFRPYFTCRRKDMCRYFQWADEIPVDAYSGQEPPVYRPRKTEMDMMKKDQKQLQRHKLKRHYLPE